MMEMSFKTFRVKVLVFIFSNLLSLWDLVDTRKLMFPMQIKHIVIYNIKQIVTLYIINYAFFIQKSGAFDTGLII